MPGGKAVHGNLTLQGAETALELHSREHFDARSETITGILHDLTRVSLIQCVTLGFGPGTRWDEAYYSATLFPHFALFGDEHLTSADRRIVSAHFTVDDAAILFHDYTSFGMVLRAESHIESVMRANRDLLDERAQATVGSRPEIFYFTGKREIFRVQTALGAMSASNNPSMTMPGAHGFSMRNSISFNIEPAEPISVQDATDGVLSVLRFIEMMIGRPQNIVDLGFRIDSKSDRPVYLDAYWSMPPQRDVAGGGRSPHHVDALVDAAGEPRYFEDVLKRWVERNGEWQESRLRFATCFSAQNRYDIDRLVGAANMFDILPASAIPSAAPLSEEISAARKKARELFLALERAPERDSVLGALGRIGKPVLKRKVRHRAAIVCSLIGQDLPDLELVLDQAIDLRNHFVHGSDCDLAYRDRVIFLGFFTEALQFVFATSDLVECGWDIKRWTQQNTVMSHPFSKFRGDYAMNLAALRAALNRTGPSSPSA